MDKRNLKRSLKEGEKFNRLTIIGFENKKYKCICDCGNITYAVSNALKNGTHKSCGCLAKERAVEIHTKPNNEAVINYNYRNYKAGAKHRKLEFDLSKKQFENLILQNCYYCNSEPLKEEAKSRKSPSDKGNFKCNGIDRINNELGYIEENCVPCCYICNIAKGKFSQDEFYQWIEKVHKFKTNKK